MPIMIETLATPSHIVAANERYVIQDYNLDDLTVSVTELEGGQETRGHSHNSNAEVYVFFGGGKGTMVVGDHTLSVSEGVVLIPKGKFHKVVNESETTPLRFLAVFAGTRDGTKARYTQRETSHLNRTSQMADVKQGLC